MDFAKLTGDLFLRALGIGFLFNALVIMLVLIFN